MRLPVLVLGAAARTAGCGLQGVVPRVQGLSGDLDEDIVERGLFGLQALDGAAGAQGIEESLVFTQAIEGELPGGQESSEKLFLI